MVFNLRYFVIGAISFSLVLFTSVKSPLLAEVTQSAVPATVLACLPDQTTNQITYEGIAGDANSGLISISVLPLAQVVPTLDPSQVFSQPQSNPGNPMPWRLVIAYNQGGCQALNTSADPEARTVPQEARQQLELARVQGLIQELGGMDAFMRRMFLFEGDDAHGGDIPENPTIPSETAWALQQLGIQLPAGWSVAP